MTDNEWRWWPRRHETVRVLHQTGTGAAATAQVVVPSSGTVERVAVAELGDVASRPWCPAEVVWRAAACRAIAALAPPGMAAAANRDLEPLPHQLIALERALAHNPVRVLLADEVGLGKTIEAGLIMSELKARGRVRRVLIVAPKGVQLQWVTEMDAHFGEEFALVGAGGVPVDAGINPWTSFDQVVCSVDAIKPLTSRKGWTPEQIRGHNAQRIDAVVEAGWDLVVFDEAHHVAGSNEDVARHRLAAELAAVAPHVLLLSATPHSGKSDAFARLLGLLDDRFAHGLPLDRGHVGPIVVRSEKRATTDNHGHALFQPRTTTTQVVTYGGRTIERALYDAVTEYVRFGYQRAVTEKRPTVGFLVLLMQRLVSSSTAAILSALERRHGAIVTEGTQLRLFPDRAEDWGDLTGEEQVEVLQGALGAAWGDELAEVEVLIDLARRSTTDGLDAKARHLLGLLDELARNHSDPDLKIVVFTEFTQTQSMLLDVLGSAGISAVAINGSMGIHERADVQEAFREHARVLVSTDAGGEGVNLQFAHIVVNYDLPWSPSKIEQRIGRVDRIGQTQPVQAFNLTMEHSVDARVREVLEAKLSVILAELGADKACDILNSADRHVPSLYTTSLVDPEDLGVAGSEFESVTRAEASQAAGFLDLLDDAPHTTTLRSGSDPIHWLDLAQAARRDVLDDAALGLADRDVTKYLPEVTPAEPIPTIGGERPGLFSVWEVDTADGERTASAVFIAEGGMHRPDLAERVWDLLLAAPEIASTPPLKAQEWTNLWDAGWGYAIRPDMLHDGTPPGLVLRLLVQVTT